MAFRFLFRTLCAAAALGALSNDGRAEEGGASECRLALVLALDVSASVDGPEYTLLSAGTARALSSDPVREAILAHGGVRVAAFEWSGQGQQRVVSDWRVMDSDDAIFATAREIAGAGRSFTEFPTALGSALGHAAIMLRDHAHCLRRVVDVAGDGPNNHGFQPRHAYNAFDFRGVTVNGLVVADDTGGGGVRPGLEPFEYYVTEVIRGPGAFVEVAAGYAEFEEAMRRKLLREVAPTGVASAE
jgi:hypothetical protein